MVNVPPLLCSTPPPIDFGEEDDDSGLPSTLNLDEGDEFSEYGLVTETHDTNKNENVRPSRLTPDCELPKENETPPPIADNCYMSRISPPPIGSRSIDSKPKKLTPVEAYNFEVACGNADLKTGNDNIKDLDDFNATENTVPDDIPKCDDGQVYFEDEEATNNDNVPSLKLDSLSLYSSASISSTTLSPVIPHDELEQGGIEIGERDMGTVELDTIPSDTNQVILEDISDDSCDEYSSKKQANFLTNENDNDFFTIQIMDMKNNDCNAFESDKLEKNLISGQEQVQLQELRAETTAATAESTVVKVNEFATFSQSPPENTDDSNEADIFGDFADFSSTFPNDAEIASSVDTAHTKIHQVQSNKEDDFFNDDNFDDFQDFENSNSVLQNVSQQDSKEATTVASTVPSDPVDCADDDDEDDFGDFSDAYIASPPLNNSKPVETKVPPPPPPAAINFSISERVKPVLEMMFPSNGQHDAYLKSQPESIDKPKHCTAIEQAKALEYQWANSEMKHALIRSLGIDSRNILFGEKWNPNIPRFAANLSFDPLKPIKTQKNDLTTETTVNNVSNSCSQGLDNFDWKNSVSPVGGADTFQRETTKIEAIHNPQSSESDGADEGQIEPEDSSVTLDTAAFDDINSNIESTITNSPDAICEFDTPTTATANFTAGTTETLSNALSTNSDVHCLDNFEQQPMQQHIDLKQQTAKAISTTTSSAELPSATSSILCNNNIEGTLISGMAATEQYMGVTVTTTTYAVPMKETHIYTPSKSDTAVAKTTTTPIDFDYEIASAGIVIDETVVKKEYHDVEYHPPFGLELEGNKLNAFDLSTGSPMPSTVYLDPPKQQDDGSVCDDDFSDFQSVPAQKSESLEKVGNSGVATFGNQMILSPAILLPQAISLGKPTIEWGDSANTNINPDELARIEELFPQPKVISAHTSPAHQQQLKQKPQTLTISAVVSKNQSEDDDWSDFVSVPITPQQQQKQQPTVGVTRNNNNNNNNNFKSRPSNKLEALTSQYNPKSTKSNISNTADADEWTDFVSSTSVPQTTTPQFNSAAWQRANFYNNPLSLYQQNQTHAFSNIVPHTTETNTKYQQQQQQQHQLHLQNYSNNNNNASNCRNRTKHQSQQQHQQQPQQIHIMHDFSTAPVDPSATRSSQLYQQQHHHHTQHLQHQHQQQQHRTNQFQIGNAKVAPRISLIPDLSFMTPALPTNAATFMSSLPKPSFSAKK